MHRGGPEIYRGSADLDGVARRDGTGSGQGCRVGGGSDGHGGPDGSGAVEGQGEWGGHCWGHGGGVGVGNAFVEADGDGSGDGERFGAGWIDGRGGFVEWAKRPQWHRRRTGIHAQWDTKMKPCFACGGRDVDVVSVPSVSAWRVQCDAHGCFAAGPVRDSASAAEHAWNMLQRPCPFAREVVRLLWSTCWNSDRTSTVFVSKESPVNIGVDRIRLAIDELEIDPWPTKQEPRP